MKAPPIAKSVRFPGLLLLLCASLTAQADVTPYPRVPGDAPNHDYVSVRVNGVPVDTTTTNMNVGYTHFAFTGTVRVEITAREPIDRFDLSPHRYEIHAKTSGATLSLELPQPRNLHLRINGLSRFFVFADTPEVDAPELGQPGVHDLADYGVTSSANRIQTAKIQRAIEDVASKHGVLYVSPGIYRSGQLKLKSNLTLYMAPGAIIKGTALAEDYPPAELGVQQVYLHDCENVTIRGRGVIDGQGRALRLVTANAGAGRTRLIQSLRAEHCAVEGVILRDAGSWGVHLVQSSDLRFTNFKLISNTCLDDPEFPWEPNTDGFDPDNSSRVFIENGFVSCSDDAVAVKLKHGKLGNMDDIQFCNNVVWTAKSALKIGTEVYGHTMTNVVFDNNEVIHADRGIAVYCNRGATIEHPRWLNNHFEFIGDNAKRMNMDLLIQDDEGRGFLRDVLIKDNTFERFSPNPSRLRGLDGAHVIDGVTFDNLVIAGKKRTDLKDARITANGHVKNVSFE